MFNVLIDSSIFIGMRYNVFSGPLMNLRKYCDKGIVKLYTHEIINHEVIKHIKKDSNEAIAQLNNKVEKIALLQVAMRHEKSTIKEQISSIPKNLEMAYIEYMADAVVLSKDGITLDEIMQDYFEIVPPFENNEKKKAEFPDAVIIKSIKRNFSKDDRSLYVVTNDTGWSAAFENDNTNQVIVIKSIQDMLNIISKQLVREDNIRAFADKQKESLLKWTVDWLEDYDCFSLVNSINDCVETDEVESLTVQKMNLIFDGIEYIDEDECYAELSFSAEAIIKVKYSYIDHSEETYDREDHVYYNTKYGEATSILRINAGIEVQISIPSKEDDDAENFDIIEMNFGLVDSVDEISTEYDENIEIDEPEYFAYYNTCPDCGVKIGTENDGGNGFCVNCASKH